MIDERTLAGLKVALSISQSRESTVLGFPPWQVNRVVVQFASAMLGQGAATLFGHDWREDGVMEAVHAMAQQMQPPWRPSEIAFEPLLQNFIAWPDRPQLPTEELERLKGSLRIEIVAPPSIATDTDALRRDSDRYKYLRARALTNMRRVVEHRSDAHVCIGGATSGFEGRYPGVVEEALFAITAGKPLFLVGALGGASQDLILALRGNHGTVSLESPDIEAKAALYSTFADIEIDADPADLRVDAGFLFESFANAGVQGLSKLNRLSLSENEELFSTPSIDRAIYLIVVGLSRIKFGPKQAT